MSEITGKDKVRYDFHSEVQPDYFKGWTCQLEINGGYPDLTDAVIIAKFRSNRTGGSFNLTEADGDISIIDAENGIFKINPFSFSSWPTGLYNHAIYFELNDGTKRTRIYGTLEVRNETNNI